MNGSGKYPRGGGGKVSYAKPRWHFDRLINFLGSHTAISERLAAQGYPRIPKSTLAGWAARNSIPPFWVPVFIQLGLDSRYIKSINDLKADPLETDHEQRTGEGADRP